MLIKKKIEKLKKLSNKLMKKSLFIKKKKNKNFIKCYNKYLFNKIKKYGN